MGSDSDRDRLGLRGGSGSLSREPLKDGHEEVLNPKKLLVVGAGLDEFSPQLLQGRLELPNTACLGVVGTSPAIKGVVSPALLLRPRRARNTRGVHSAGDPAARPAQHVWVVLVHCHELITTLSLLAGALASILLVHNEPQTSDNP